MITLGIVGGGVLGHSICRGFMEHAEVRVYDVIREKTAASSRFSSGRGVHGTRSRSMGLRMA